MPTGHQQSLQEPPHDESLCPQCQLAHNPQGNPRKAGVSGRGINRGGWSATPTELQANSTAASMGQPLGAVPRQGEAYTTGNASLSCFQHAKGDGHKTLVDASMQIFQYKLVKGRGPCAHPPPPQTTTLLSLPLFPPRLPPASHTTVRHNCVACHPIGSCLDVRNNVVNFCGLPRPHHQPHPTLPDRPPSRGSGL